jgi:hypothetical protein
MVAMQQQKMCMNSAQAWAQSKSIQVVASATQVTTSKGQTRAQVSNFHLARAYVSHITALWINLVIFSWSSSCLVDLFLVERSLDASCVLFKEAVAHWPRYIYYYSNLWEQISYEWKEIHQIRSRAVAVMYFAVVVTIRCDWMRRKQWEAISVLLHVGTVYLV